MLDDEITTKKLTASGAEPRERVGAPRRESRQSAVSLADRRHHTLEMSIGREIRRLRKKYGMTVIALANQAGLSSGMLSKIENGLTSPSLSTIQALAAALNVSVTTLFRRHEQRRDATMVKAGEGLIIHRRGSLAGHEYRLLGHSVGKNVTMEPYLITLTDKSEVFPSFQHSGTELIYILEGRIDYHHSGVTYELGPGDSLFFDGEAPHGPERLIQTPIRFICCIAHGEDESEEE
jgi:transcriptional regulator with XRE-family HTH domain